MATKYVDTTATYNGDGTLSTPASGAGLPGAWNNLVGVLTDNATYPIANGDTVIVRSADASGNPITVNVTSTLTMATRGSLSDPVQWIFDAGVVWPYANVVTLSISSTVVFTFAACNWFDCDGDNLRLRLLHNQAGGASLNNGVMFAQGVYLGIEVKTANVATGNYNFILGFGTSPYKETRLVKCKFDMSLCSTTGGTFGNINGLQYSTTFFDECTFDFSRAPAVPAYLFAGTSTTAGVIVSFRGGRVIGCNDTTALIYYSTSPSSFYNIRYYADGFDVGSMELMRMATWPALFGDLSELVFNNMAGVLGQFIRMTLQGTVDWYPGRNYPTLNALLPDGSNTPWSIRVQPRTTNVSLSYPLSISSMAKFYDLAPSVKTITVELLLSESFATMRKKDWWIDVIYVEDATSLSKVLTTFNLVGNLDVSTAEWTTMFYGAKNYIKRKISIQTPSAVKRYSDISVVLRSALPAPSTTDFYFVCPDFKVE